MSRLKCLACPHLERKTVPVKGWDLVVYNCDKGRFPYPAALSGLLRPRQGIYLAAQDCYQIPIPGQCVVCREPGETGLSHDPIIPLCVKHYRAWIAWLNDQKRDYFHPGQRIIHTRWLEVFWEFVASARVV